MEYCVTGMYSEVISGGNKIHWSLKCIMRIHDKQVGDQILEVNGVSFLNIVHADAARALR